MLQLRDGRILVNESQNPDPGRWFVLTPDARGSYVNGTWSSGGHLPAGYAPVYFGSQVLLDGKTVVIEGGEYNNGTAVWTTKGARLTYSGNTFTWVNNNPPTGWTTIGDAQSIILPDGRYLQANCCTTQSAFYCGPNCWTANANIVGTDNDEGAYTLLPNGKLLMVDAWSTACSASFSSELYDPTHTSWSCGPDTPVQLWDNSGHELGPATLLHNGKVFYVGATNATAIYNPATNSWSNGPVPPNHLTGYDAPAALEPTGKVLEMFGPTGFGSGCQFMEYNPTTGTLSNVPNPADCPGDPSFVGHLMILPSGQIMFTDFSGLVEVFTPSGSVDPVAKPTITSAPSHLTAGSHNNVLHGTQLNGLSQNSTYGDDYQGDTNFPLIRLTNNTTGNVYWATTHNESTHSIAHGTVMLTKFDVPVGVPNGTYRLNVVTSGVLSNTFMVSIP